MTEELNTEQLEACQNTEGPLLVLAGAGTGKTRVLTQRVANIISSQLAYPSQIMAVTFTNKAANEMLTRIEGIVDTGGIWVGTFHSLATRIIRNHTEELGIAKDFTIIDVNDQWRLLKKIIREKKLDEKEFSPKVVGGIIGRWKDLGLFPRDLTDGDTIGRFQISTKHIYTEYQDRLKTLAAVDFGDLLLFCLKLFKEHPDVLEIYQNKFHYIMVDEYQDTNVTQYLWLRYLSQKHKNICAVGDEDQSIYGWRGAEIRNIMKFSHDFPGAKIIRLEQNYRSTKHILSTANHLIAKNTTRIGKNLWTENLSEEKVKIITHDNAYRESESIVQAIKNLPSDISRNEIAVLVRASFQTRLIEDSFIQNQIPYKIIGGLKFYDRLEIKNALCYIRLSYNFNDSLALERIINTPKRGIGPATLSQIQNYATTHQCSYFNAIQIMITNQYFKGKTYTTLSEFVNKIETWNKLWENLPCSEVANIILNESGYIQSLKTESTLESESRLDNLDELLRNIEEFQSIKDFLEHVSLVNESDSSDSSNIIKIMTMHAAKGLEFSIVFLPGWEEGLFPSKRSIDEKDTGLEEERRLAYVAITRAKQNLFISYANSRQVFGEWQYNLPSRFICEIEKLESVEHPKSNNTQFNAYKKYDFPKKTSLWQTNSFSNKPDIINTNINDTELRTGDKVEHKKFGIGTILIVNDQTADIFFNSCGKKTIMKTFVIKVN
jgi:DNA helicase-2/ATP-dependent DNA helicase PcrA